MTQARVGNKKDPKAAEQLAKVLWYYNLLPELSRGTQKIVCPFHGDVNPSMLVNLHEGNWYCFGCGEAGDAKRFVELMEKKYNDVNDLQAYKVFLDILKSKKCSKIHVSAIPSQKRAKPLKQLYDEAYDYYHGLRTVDWMADEEEEVVEARDYMVERGFKPSTLNKVRAKVTYNYSYSIIFPLMDNGKFRGWDCRTMRPEIEKRRKYLYNEGFSRATTLCGNYGKEKYVFVVEGYMDYLRFIEQGITNVVALLGWKMSAEQEQKLRSKGVEHIISVLDNDKAGRKGTQYLKTLFPVTRWQYLKGIKDPGEMDKEAFHRMYKRTMKLYDKQRRK